jgi:hypothetical protein
LGCTAAVVLGKDNGKGLAIKGISECGN